MMMKQGGEYILQAEGIYKSFGGVRALRNVDFALSYNDVHALVGENGAGKSTFSKLVAGVFPADEGRLHLEGQPYSPRNRNEGTESGVCIIYQEPSLISCLSVAENMFLGRLAKYTNRGVINWDLIHKETKVWLERLELNVSPHAMISDLSLGEAKLIELAKALLAKPKVLIIDEATAILNNREAKILFREMEKFRDAGNSIIYISHHLEEIFEICSTVTVFKDGQVVTTTQVADVDKDQLSRLMVGREVDTNIYREESKKGKYQDNVILSAHNLSFKAEFQQVDLQLRPGEILGIGGLVGSGKEHVAEVLFGIHQPDTGTIFMEGQQCSFNHPAQAIASGIAYLPKERDEEGLIVIHSICDNINLPILSRLRKRGVLQRTKERQIANDYLQRLRIKAKDIDVSTNTLSGGNRQKVVLGKWLASKPKVLILNNPTRGVDVGVKSEVYTLMQELVEEGIAILLISDELPELIGLSDRILIMRNGSISASFDTQTDDISEERIIACMV
ncbi:MAG: sugar ABC transporter ATP-binding protein [Limnochordia bacterium]|jgi:ribose transport system ATP-binding protein